MQMLTGIVTVTQENRFRLVTDAGQAKLFLLAPDAGVEAQDLTELQRNQTRVRVRYAEAERLLASIAHHLSAEPSSRGEFR